MPTLNDLTIKQLKSLAKSYEFTSYSKLNKSDLIELIIILISWAWGKNIRNS